MKVSLFSIQDKLIGFKTPFPEVSKEVAERNFRIAIEQEYKGESYSPLFDMSLYRLAEFDSSTGLLTPLDSPEFVTSGTLIIPLLNLSTTEDDLNEI